MTIIDKAKQLGLDVGDGTTSIDNLRAIASQVGFDGFNSSSDIGALENMLDEQITQNNTPTSQDEVEMLDDVPRKEKFGEREYNKAIGKDGKYDKNYYKNKGEELAKKTEEAKKNRDKNYKTKKGEEGKPIKSDGSNTKKKNKMDRVMDNLKVLNSQKNELVNKVAGAKANARNVLNAVEDPLGTAENAVKDKIKEHTTDKLKKEAKAKAKKVASKAGAKIRAFIASNPWVLLILGAAIILFIIIVALMSSSKVNGYYSQVCNFNASTVLLTECGAQVSEEEGEEKVQVTTLSLKEYVLGTTYQITSNRNLTDSQIEAIMIIMKTNALSYGNYDNSNKILNLDTCRYSYVTFNEANNEYSDYEELYTEIENYLYLSSSYNNSIDYLSYNNALEFNNSIIEKISKNTGNYTSILNSIYDKDANEDKISYTNNLFIGDSRIYDMRKYGIIANNKVIYGSGYGLDWFSGSNEFSASNTNALNGAISEANKRMLENTNYNIIIWLGINDLENVGNYYNKYYELASGEWSNNNIYVVGVGKVNSDTISNDVISEFNNNMSNLINGSGLDNLKYINLDYEVKEYMEDGIHYSKSDYQKIYSLIMSNLGVSSSISKQYKLYDLDDYCEYIYVDGEYSESTSCEEMSISSTSLSKDEFISKVKNYYMSNGNSFTKDFSDNAGIIYDLATANGINPELVVVRASAEGYSPVSKGYPSYNNYWGLRCYNGKSLSTCASYNSFEDGVLAFINNVSSYNSLSSLMQKYAYIGDYWYNPGDAGNGGCYFYPYLEKYLSSSRSNEVAQACNSSKACSGSSCLETNEEDQLAYSKYQVELMASLRNTIFNITSDFCAGYSSNCTIFAQGDPKWSSIHLGSSNSTMGVSGCAVTSLAIGISCSGTQVNVANFDAGKLIEVLNENKCFTSDGAIYWNCDGIRQIAPNVNNILNKTDLQSFSVDYTISLINQYNVGSNFVLVYYKNSIHQRGHYSVITSVNGNKLIVKDPAGGKVSTIDARDVSQVLVYST